MGLVRTGHKGTNDSRMKCRPDGVGGGGASGGWGRNCSFFCTKGRGLWANGGLPLRWDLYQIGCRGAGVCAGEGLVESVLIGVWWN